MSVDAHISGGTRKALVLTIRDVFLCLRVHVLLGQTEVDDVYNVLVRCAVASHEKILRLDIAIYQVFAVHVLDASNLKGGEARGNYNSRGCGVLD